MRNPKGYKLFTIKSFKHKGLENFFYSSTKKGIKPEHADKLERILDRLHASSDLKDMNYPSSNLHALSGDRKGQYSVRVSGNWRVIFEFINGDAYIVDYDDYHQKISYGNESNEKTTNPPWKNLKRRLFKTIIHHHSGHGFRIGCFT
ncbi:MAG: type II toxin-antitoxin system RelE/ParE family toxin [Desulfoarculaceae bacterium]|nr:type II toxin-antitoxin system RelE/ParE family toxin [Desulfoarculaceae bacterium]